MYEDTCTINMHISLEIDVHIRKITKIIMLQIWETTAVKSPQILGTTLPWWIFITSGFSLVCFSTFSWTLSLSQSPRPSTSAYSDAHSMDLKADKFKNSVQNSSGRNSETTETNDLKKTHRLTDNQSKISWSEIVYDWCSCANLKPD